MVESHVLRSRIWTKLQHPYHHSLSEFVISNPALPGVTNMEDAFNWLVAVLYPNTQPSVATPGDLPTGTDTPNVGDVTPNLRDYRVVLDDGDGKAASYRYEQREGDASPIWYKIYDMDWGEQSILSNFLVSTQDVYVYKYGISDKDENGDVLTGTLSGQHVYGGDLANQNLTLHANSGDGVGANTGFIQFDDNSRPTSDNAYDIGTLSEKFKTGYFGTSVHVGLLTISTNTILSSNGSIDFNDENLSTTGTLTAGITTINGHATLQQVTTPFNPPAGFDSLYFKNDDKLYRLTSGGVEKLVGLDFTSTNDNRLVKSSGTGGDALEESGVIVSDLDALTGVTALTIDNLFLDGNTISSLDTNGDINLIPDGTGSVREPATGFVYDISDNTFREHISSGTNDIWFGAATIATGLAGPLNSYETGGYTYFKDPAVQFTNGTYNWHGIYRTSVGSGSANVVAPNLRISFSTNDKLLVPRTDGTLTSTGIDVDGSDNVTGMLSLDVANFLLTGNTLSSTDTNGNIIFSPDGSGNVVVVGGSSTVVEESFVDGNEDQAAFNVTVGTLNNSQTVFPFVPSVSGDVISLSMRVGTMKNGVIVEPSDGQMKAYLYSYSVGGGGEGVPVTLLDTSTTVLASTAFNGDAIGSISTKTFVFNYTAVAGTTYLVLFDYENYTGDSDTDWGITAPSLITPSNPIRWGQSNNNGANYSFNPNLWHRVEIDISVSGLGTLRPSVDSGLDLGTTSNRIQNLFLSGSIDDGTDSISVATLLAFRDALVGVADGHTLFYDNASGKFLPSLPDLEIDHGEITGLLDDDHTQYVLLSGRSGGQEIVGDTDASGNLLLSATSDATKGSIFAKDNLSPFVDASAGLREPSVGETFSDSLFMIQYKIDTATTTLFWNSGVALQTDGPIAGLNFPYTHTDGWTYHLGTFQFQAAGNFDKYALYRTQPGAFTGTDLGDPTHNFANLYIKGELFGARLENILSTALPAFSSNNKGRMFYSTDTEKLYVDTGSQLKVAGVGKHLEDLAFNGVELTKTINVSANIGDARNALIQLLDNTNNFERIYCKIEATSQTDVRVTTTTPLPAGSYRLIVME